ncbi:MAG: putative toxin-antitoxin system toxin component, PIN family [Candidatus Sabulitectum sp.]|nr:putative toxin-antitoxin system toxin component, PIN family [Candidatus Sabulitectum sp.]
MSSLRVVLDSNVYISAFLFGGVPAGVIELALGGSILVYTSIPILDEIRDVLRRPKFGLSSSQAFTLIEEIHSLCRMVSSEEQVLAVKEDPDDNKILECALAAGVEVIVSGDSHLLRLQQWRGIKILTPADFLRKAEHLTKKQ